MTDLTLLLLRLGFLLVLWLFVFTVVIALRSDMFGERARKLRDPRASKRQPSAAPASPKPAAPASNPQATIHNAHRLVIISGPKEGLEVPLNGEPLTIGRSSDSGLVIRDDYTSTHHARLVVRGDEWVIHDLDSTNGTFLGGTRLTTPTPIPLGTPIKIGTTSFELRR